MLFNGNGSVKLSLHKYSHVSQSFILASNNLLTVAKGIGLFLCYKWSVPQWHNSAFFYSIFIEITSFSEATEQIWHYVRVKFSWLQSSLSWSRWSPRPGTSGTPTTGTSSSSAGPLTVWQARWQLPRRTAGRSRATATPSVLPSSDWTPWLAGWSDKPLTNPSMWSRCLGPGWQATRHLKPFTSNDHFYSLLSGEQMQVHIVKKRFFWFKIKLSKQFLESFDTSLGVKVRMTSFLNFRSENFIGFFLKFAEPRKWSISFLE